MTETTLIPGTSVFYRPGRFRRTGRPYFSADTTITEFKKFADKHDGKVLMPVTYRWLSDDFMLEPRRMHLIVWSIYSGKALVGIIEDAGKRYEPERPPIIPGYETPSPWNMIPTRTWVALSAVRVIDFDVSQYMSLPISRGLKPRPLEEIQGGSISITRICPNSEYREH